MLRLFWQQQAQGCGFRTASLCSASGMTIEFAKARRLGLMVRDARFRQDFGGLLTMKISARRNKNPPHHEDQRAQTGIQVFYQTRSALS